MSKEIPPSGRTCFALAAALALLLLAACGGRGSATLGALDAEDAASETTDAGLCSHPYYPVVLGASHTYVTTATNSDPFEFTDTITEVRSDGFRVVSNFGDRARAQEWFCTPEGLATAQYTGGAATVLRTAGLIGELETSNRVGVSLPAGVAPGDTWTQTFDMAGDLNMAGGGTATASGSAAYSFSAVTIEEVTTLAGTFSALRVESTVSTTMQVSGDGGFEFSFNLNSDVVLWFVEGVGWVRTEDASTLGDGGSFTYTVDLQSYFIP